MKKEEADEKLMQEILDDEVTFYSDVDNPTTVYVEYPTFTGACAFESINSPMFEAYLGFRYRELSGDNILPDYGKLLAIERQNLLFRQENGVRINRRVAGSITKGTIGYFLADREWSLILIKAKGWKKAKSKKLKFLRSVFDEAQVEPVGGGNLLNLLGKYINMDQDSIALFVVHVVQAFSRYSSHFAAILSSNKGTGKTTLTKVMRALVDPSETGATLMPSSEGDLKNMLANNYMVAFDNTAALSGSVSNVLCAAITGSKAAKRKLYTDCDEIVLNLHNLVVLNGIDIVPYKSDLAERSLLFELQPIDKEKRKTDAEFWGNFEKNRPKILGAIFDTLVKAMELMPMVEHKDLHRMADANVEMIAIAMALGISQEGFQKILDNNKKKLQEAYNQSNPFVEFVVSYMWGKSEVNMAATDLYRDMHSQIVGTAKFFPESPSMLSRRLNQEKEALFSLGYEFSKGEKKRNNNYLVIRRIPDSRLTQKQVEQMARRAALLENASTEE